MSKQRVYFYKNGGLLPPGGRKSELGKEYDFVDYEKKEYWQKDKHLSDIKIDDKIFTFEIVVYAGDGGAYTYCHGVYGKFQRVDWLIQHLVKINEIKPQKVRKQKELQNV